MQPLVSILIPAYNAEKYIADTLRSALAQTWPAKEIIVVEDGSRDHTLAIAQSFESAGVRVIQQTNSGAAAARNRGYRECRGDFIQYLDADDLLAPDKIERQMRRLADEEPRAVAACRWARFHDDPATGWFRPEPFWQDMAPIDWLVNCWERASMMHPAAWLLPRALVEAAGPWDETLSLNDDGEFFARVVLASTRVCFCPDAISYYRSNLPSSLSGTKTPAGWDSGLRSIESATSRLLDRENGPRTRRACVRQFQEFIYAAYPDCPELLRRAERRLAELGGSQFPPPGGPKFRAVAAFLGWRMAKRMLRLKQRWSAGWK